MRNDLKKYFKKGWEKHAIRDAEQQEEWEENHLDFMAINILKLLVPLEDERKVGLLHYFDSNETMDQLIPKMKELVKQKDNAGLASALEIFLATRTGS